MQKISEIFIDREIYDISAQKNGVALINDGKGNSALLDVLKDELITDYRPYHTLYGDRLFVQKYEDEKTNTKRVYIYDTILKKMVANNYELINEYYENKLLSLKDEDGDIRLFDYRTYNSDKSIFNEKLGTCEYLSQYFNYYHEYYIKVSLKDKPNQLGLYRYKNGLELDYEYDDIKAVNIEKSKYCSFIIIYKNGQKFLYSPNKREIIDTFDSYGCCYKSHYIDYILYTYQNDTGILKAYKNDTRIYELKKLFATSSLHTDKLEYVTGDACTSFYKLRRNSDNKCILVSYEEYRVNPNITYLTRNYVDDIKCENNDFYLYNDGKVGLYYLINEKYNLAQSIEPLYDSIKKWGDYYITQKDGIKNFVELTKNGFESIYENIEGINDKESSYSYVVKTENKEIILYKKHENRYDAGTFMASPMYDGVKNVYKDLYVTNDNNLYGIYYSTNELLKPSKKSIDYISKNDNFFFNIDGKELLKLYVNYDYTEHGKEELKPLIKADNIELFKDFVVVLKGDTKYLYDYKNLLNNEIKSIKAFSKDTKIDYKKINYNKKFYIINGVYFYFKDNAFIKVPTYEIPVYKTTFIDNDTTIILTSKDKDEHDYLTNGVIEAMYKDEIPEVIDRYFKKSKVLIKENKKFNS